MQLSELAEKLKPLIFPWIAEVAGKRGGVSNTSSTIDTEQFVVLATSARLANERVLTGTANQIIITDGGAGTTVTLSLFQQNHIVDADGTLADATAKINVILVALETIGIVNTT